jgi:hypothetical protein
MARPGWARGVVVLALGAACGLAAPVGAAVCEPPPKQDEVHVLLIELVVFRGLGGRQVDQLRKEIESVWAEQGVTIAWSSVPTPASVRVVIDRPATALPVAATDGAWSVAHARIVRGRVVPPIYASVEAGERVVRAATQASGSPGQNGPLLSRVLARAIAHELAHLLLDTGTHSPHGLLRARFTAAEFVAPTTEAFGLDLDQRTVARRHPLLLIARVAQPAGLDAPVPVVVATGTPREPRPCSFVAVSRLAARADLRVAPATDLDP